MQSSDHMEHDRK